MAGRAAKLKIPAKSRNKQTLRTYSDYPVPFTATSDKDGGSVFINKMKTLLLTPTEYVIWRDVIIEPG